MKQNQWIWCIGFVLPLMTACSADPLVTVDTGHGLVEINLNGGIGTTVPSAMTKAVPQGMINGKDTWADDLTVTFARADASNNDYTAWKTEVLSAHIKKEVEGNPPVHKIAFTAPTYYLANGQKTKLIGWYPVGTFDATSHKVTFASDVMDGETDYMVTDMVVGSKATDSRIKSVNFNHLLMQFIVKVYAEDADAQSIWGGIKSIAVKGMKETCEVTLPTAAADASNATARKATVAFTNTFPKATDLPLVKKNFRDNTKIIYSDASPLELGLKSANAKLAGYAMFAPQGSKDITLTVVTENGDTQNPKVKAPVGGFQAGYSYEVVLKFGTSRIAPVVTITDWESGTDPDEVII